jgi:hypothetical protein
VSHARDCECFWCEYEREDMTHDAELAAMAENIQQADVESPAEEDSEYDPVTEEWMEFYSTQG